MPTFFLVVMLLVPGMASPAVNKTQMDTYEACLAKVEEAGVALKEHDGEAYKFFIGCEVTSGKSDPA